MQYAEGVHPWTIPWQRYQIVLVVILLIGLAFSASLGHGLETAANTVIVLSAVRLGFI